MRSVPCSLALCKRQGEEVEGTVKPFSLGKEPSS